MTLSEIIAAYEARRSASLIEAAMNPTPARPFDAVIADASTEQLAEIERRWTAEDRPELEARRCLALLMIERRRRESGSPVPIGPQVVLTPLGDAVVTLYRLKRQIDALDPAQRAEVAGLAVVELGLLPGPLPLPEEKDARYCFFCGVEYPADLFDCPTCPAA